MKNHYLSLFIKLNNSAGEIC
uniref:Uncharacterized protein n=1 Tax=Arundo donax TaxID=35708 RepID=A0A0A9F0J8_ARUDO